MKENRQPALRDHLEQVLANEKRDSPLIKALMDRIHLDNTDIPENNLRYYNQVRNRVRQRRAGKHGKEYAEGLQRSHEIFAPYFEGWQEKQGQYDTTYVERLRGIILADLHDINNHK